MAGMIGQLLEIMDEQVERHKELLGLSLEEKDAIVQNDIETLGKLISLKNIVISQNNRLEKKRISLVNDIALVMGSDKTDIDFASLVDIMKDLPEEEQLKDVGARLRDVVSDLKEANDLNRELLESALEYVEFSINALKTSVLPEQSIPIRKGPVETDNFGTFDATR